MHSQHFLLALLSWNLYTQKGLKDRDTIVMDYLHKLTDLESSDTVGIQALGDRLLSQHISKSCEARILG